MDSSTADSIRGMVPSEEHVAHGHRHNAPCASVRKENLNTRRQWAKRYLCSTVLCCATLMAMVEN